MKYPFGLLAGILMFVGCDDSAKHDYKPDQNFDHKLDQKNQHQASSSRSETLPNIESSNASSAIEIPAHPESKMHTFSQFGFEKITINDAFKKLNLVEIKDSRLDDCFYAQSLDHPNLDLNIQVIDQKVAVLSTTDPSFRSYKGVAVGDSEQSVALKHGNVPFEKQMNPYGDFKTQYSIFYWYDQNKDKGTRYDIDQQKVIEMYVGNQHLELMEGCA